jgi:hypothetical protein
MVSAKVESTNLSQTTPVTVTAGPPSPPHSSADVSDGMAGSATAVAIQLRDVFGNPVGGSAGAISLVVRGSNSATPTAAGAGGGSYTASYTPTRTGTDQVDVRVNGSALPDTPLLSQVVAGPADPGHTTAEIADGGIFIPMDITVSTADRYANPLQRGGDKVAVAVRDRGTVGMTDHGDGSYSGSYTPTALGTILIEIRLNGSPIAGSPFERTILFK